MRHPGLIALVGIVVAMVEASPSQAQPAPEPPNLAELNLEEPPEGQGRLGLEDRRAGRRCPRHDHRRHQGRDRSARVQRVLSNPG